MKAASKSSQSNKSKHKNNNPLSPKLGSPSRKGDGSPPRINAITSPNRKLGEKGPTIMKNELGSPTRKSAGGSLSGQSDDESIMLSKLSSPTKNDPATRLPSPTERSKLFAETLFNKIRTEVERDNKNDEMRMRSNSGVSALTDSGQSQTNDEDSSDSFGSHAMEYDTDERTGESDVSNRAFKRSADELSEGKYTELNCFIKTICNVMLFKA